MTTKFYTSSSLYKFDMIKLNDVYLYICMLQSSKQHYEFLVIFDQMYKTTHMIREAIITMTCSEWLIVGCLMSSGLWYRIKQINNKRYESHFNFEKDERLPSSS